MTQNEGKAELLYKDESYAIIGACFAVYKEKGRGFLLSATGCELGLLVNFGHYPKMEYERLITRKQQPVDVYL